MTEHPDPAGLLDELERQINYWRDRRPFLQSHIEAVAVAKKRWWENRDELLRLARLGLEAKRQHEPIADTYACQRCGRRDGLDTVLPNELWKQVVEGEWANPDPATRRGEVINGKWNLLCLWCIDAICAEKGIKCSASLHFCGKAITGGSQSDADREHISRLTRQLDAAMKGDG